MALTETFTLIVKMPEAITFQMPKGFLYSCCFFKLWILRKLLHQYNISFFQLAIDNELVVHEHIIF